VLVVGSTGGVGQLVVAKLLESGFRVKALARSEESARALFADAFASDDDAFEVVTGVDLRDAAALERSGACVGVDAIVSCVGTTAFPSARWRDGNGPEATDFVSGAFYTLSPNARRIVLVSSIGVTRTDRMPFLVLNLFGVLKFKAMGEQAVVDSGIPYTILRPGRLTDGPYTSYDVNTVLRATSGTRRAVDLRLGDDLLPEETSRIVVADAAVAALSSAACVGKGYCLGTREGEGPGSDFGKWDALFEGAGGVS
ncbi:uncharacterized protein MICPUCDRAFT_20482, partial [Micromonas pusilla CCMP1545]